MLLTVNQVVSYASHSVTQNGIVKLTLKARFDEITSSMKLLQMLTTDIGIKVKSPASDAIKSLGTFKISGVSFNASGQSILKFTSLNDAVEFDAINELITTQEFRVKYTCHVDDEES